MTNVANQPQAESKSLLDQYGDFTDEELVVEADNGKNSKGWKIDRINSEFSEDEKYTLWRVLKINAAELKKGNHGEEVDFYLMRTGKFGGGDPRQAVQASTALGKKLKIGQQIEYLEKKFVTKNIIAGFSFTGTNDTLYLYEVDKDGKVKLDDKKKPVVKNSIDYGGISVILQDTENGQFKSINAIKLV